MKIIVICIICCLKFVFLQCAPHKSNCKAKYESVLKIFGPHVAKTLSFETPCVPFLHFGKAVGRKKLFASFPAKKEKLNYILREIKEHE